MLRHSMLQVAFSIEYHVSEYNMMHDGYHVSWCIGGNPGSTQFFFLPDESIAGGQTVDKAIMHYISDQLRKYCGA